MTNLVASKEVQTLLDRASGICEAGGNARLKAIMRDFLESTMSLIEKHDITESEFWQAIDYLQNSAPEFKLIVPGVGVEHFLDLHMDAKDAAAGLSGGTPRTIEGPLYVAGAPLVESGANHFLSSTKTRSKPTGWPKFCGIRPDGQTITTNGTEGRNL